jgi:methionyl aminopeptidase
MSLIKSNQEIKIMIEGGMILTQIMAELKNRTKPGIKTKELDELAEHLIYKYKAQPAFKRYNNFPATLCTSINSVIVHGIPTDRRLKLGDIISLDLGILWKGYYLDMAITVGIGKIEPEVERLIAVTKKALEIAINEARDGNYIGDIGFVIEKYVAKMNLRVVRDLCGHGIGKKMHEEPQILNFGQRGEGMKIKKGMVLCLEPMVVLGKEEIKQSQDGIGWETKDGSLSAHFEQTILVTKKEPLILTAFNF